MFRHAIPLIAATLISPFVMADGLIGFPSQLGGTQSYATGVSVDGTTVVGKAYVAGDSSIAAFVYKNGTYSTLPSQNISDFGTEATAISANGATVVGINWVTGASANIGIWQSGTAVNIGYAGRAWGVSSDGSTVVGHTTISGSNTAFVWKNSTFTQIGTLGGTSSFAQNTNATGTVVIGFAANASNKDRAFSWTSAGGMVDLGTLGGSSSYAYGINASGSKIVGNAELTVGSFAHHATLWDNGVIQDLGTLGSSSEALAISGDGNVVVGKSFISGVSNSFVWDQTYGMRNLNDILANQGIDLSGWALASASAVTTDGTNYYIAGTGTHNGVTQGYLATVSASVFAAVPEPSEYGMAGVAALAVTALIRRRKRA